MKPRKAEVLLATLYLGSTLLSVISIISLVTAWQHWAWTLDTCISVDCGCILYGINAFRTFLGGDVRFCHFGSFALIPGILIALCLGGYHGYRCSVHKNLENPRRITREAYSDDRNNLNGQIVVVQVKRRAVFKQWMPVAFITALISCLSLAHMVVITDGYYRTCDQYRRNLVEILDSRGREIQVIHNRLPCGAIFDYMDYLQPDTNNWVRGSEINTGVALQLAITTKETRTREKKHSRGQEKMRTTEGKTKARNKNNCRIPHIHLLSHCSITIARVEVTILSFFNDPCCVYVCMFLYVCIHSLRGESFCEKERFVLIKNKPSYLITSVSPSLPFRNTTNGIQFRSFINRITLFSWKFSRQNLFFPRFFLFFCNVV